MRAGRPRTHLDVQTELPGEGDVAPLVRLGEGPPLLLLHGLGMSWRAWRPVLGPLAAQHEVLAPTLPGHRGGPRAPRPVRVSWLADYLELLLDEQGIGTVHVAGNSLGGWLALELAHRGRARSVTAVSPAGARRHLGDQLRLALLLGSADLAKLNPALGPSAAAVLRSPRGRRAALRVLLEHGDRLSPLEAGATLRDSRACHVVPGLLRTGWRDGLAELPPSDVPVRVLWGDRDRVLPFVRHGRPLRPLLPTAEHVRLHGAGHVPMHDVPDRLVGLLAQQVAHGERVRSRGSSPAPLLDPGAATA